MIQLLRSLLITSVLSLVGCGLTPLSQSTGTSLPETAEIVVSPGDGRVGSYVSSWQGFRTSSYWIEGPDGLILIDTQFLPSAAEEMVNWAESVTGKKAVMAIVLHPNPDKFNGTAVLQKRGIEVVTADQVLKEIPAVHELRKGWFYDRFKPDYPSELPRPDSFGNQTREITAAGITLKAHVLGAGCSSAHVVVEYDDHIFVGDLITIGFHSWLELGLLPSWLKRLDELEKMEPEWVHTGRGGTGAADAIERERKYLNDVIGVFKRHQNKSKSLTKATSAKILEDIVALYPSYDYPIFVRNGIEATWANLAKNR